MDKYYISNGLDKKGPFTIEEIKNSNYIKISSNTKVWKDGFEDWVYVKQVEEFQNLITKMPPPLPIVNETKTIVNYLFQFVAFFIIFSFVLFFLLFFILGLESRNTDFNVMDHLSTLFDKVTLPIFIISAIISVVIISLSSKKGKQNHPIFNFNQSSQTIQDENINITELADYLKQEKIDFCHLEDNIAESIIKKQIKKGDDFFQQSPAVSEGMFVSKEMKVAVYVTNNKIHKIFHLEFNDNLIFFKDSRYAAEVGNLVLSLNGEKLPDGVYSCSLLKHKVVNSYIVPF